MVEIGGRYTTITDAVWIRSVEGFIPAEYMIEPITAVLVMACQFRLFDVFHVAY